VADVDTEDRLIASIFSVEHAWATVAFFVLAFFVLAFFGDGR
jgi:hypothetical protein